MLVAQVPPEKLSDIKENIQALLGLSGTTFIVNKDIYLSKILMVLMIFNLKVKNDGKIQSSRLNSHGDKNNSIKSKIP
jgi:hypothetical protein